MLTDLVDYLNHCVADYLFTEHIALLEGLAYKVFAHGLVVFVHYRVVKIGVEFFSVGFNLAYADFRKNVGKQLGKCFDSLVIGCEFKRLVERVGKRKYRLYRIAVCIAVSVAFFLCGALAVIVVLGGKTEEFIVCLD